MAGFLKGLAFAAGAGLSIGMVTLLKQRATAVADAPLPLEPLLDRLESLEAAFEQAFRQRLAAAERTILEQSISIRTLREAAETSEANLQRLIAFADTSPAGDSFNAHLNRAMRDPQFP